MGSTAKNMLPPPAPFPRRPDPPAPQRCVWSSAKPKQSPVRPCELWGKLLELPGTAAALPLARCRSRSRAPTVRKFPSQRRWITATTRSRVNLPRREVVVEAPALKRPQSMLAINQAGTPLIAPPLLLRQRRMSAHFPTDSSRRFAPDGTPGAPASTLAGREYR